MALTKEELIGSLQNEVRILLHLITKVEPGVLDYRPSAKQRSTIELLRYLSYMTPALLPSIRQGQFDTAAWTAAEAAAKTQSLEQVTAAIAAQSELIAKELGNYTDADFSGQVQLFGPPMSRASMIANVVLCGFAAYRMQLFLYLKANGREELNTFNLWAGMDGQMPATA